MAPPKKYSEKQRAEAIARWRSADPPVTIAWLARELEINPETLRIWIRQDEAEHGSPHADAPMPHECPELRRLRDENEQLRRINMILGAATAFFVAQIE